MKRMLQSVLLASLSAISLSSFAEEKPLHQSFKGAFSYEIAGDYLNPAGQIVKLTESGVFVADGKGGLVANGFVSNVTSDLLTPLFAGRVSYQCNYHEFKSKIPSIIGVRCDRQEGSNPVQAAEFILSTVKGFGLGLGGEQSVKIVALSVGGSRNLSIAGNAISAKAGL